MRFAFLLTALFTAGTLSLVHAETKTTETDRVVAKVNDEKIYKSGIDIIVSDFAKTGTIIDEKTRKTLIERLVDQKIIAQFAKKKGYLKHDSVQKQIQVMTELVLHDRYFSDFIQDKMTPKAIKQEFDKKMQSYKPRFEYKASHILVDSFEKATDIKKQLDHDNQKFSDLAKQYSSDGNAETGGDLGYFSPEMMVKPFSDAVATLKVNAISAPVKTDFGWHIIQLTDKRLLQKPTFEQLKPSIETELARKLMAEHTNDLKKQSEIQIYAE